MNNKITVNDTDRVVAEYLTKRGVMSYQAIHIADNSKNKDWPSDLWRIVFTAQNHSEFVAEFHTGLGHRISTQKYGKLSPSQQSGIKELKMITGMASACTKIDDFTYAVTPTQANVMYCLLSDAECGKDTFDDFCSNCGYDTDSRKALEIYLTCQETNARLNKFFSRETINTLQELLQDY